MAIRIWWLMAICTAAIGLAILREGPPSSDAGARPEAQAEAQPPQVAARRSTQRGG